MNKKITMIDVLIEISKGNVKHGTKFNVLYKNNLKRKVYYDANEPNAFSCIKNVSDDLPIYDEVRFNEEVEILEDEEEIDIQNIEELQTFSDSTVYDYNDIDRNRKVLNMLVKAVKKLDKNKVDYIQPYKEEI